jgi:hypothetical protein
MSNDALRGQIDLLRQHHPWPVAKPAVEPNGGPVWFHDDHRKVFSRYINDQTKVVLELGSFLGRSTLGILSIAPNATVIAVDTWKGSQEHHAPEFAGLLPTLYQTFLVNTWEHRDRLIAVRSDTTDGIAEIAALGIEPDMVYVDAGHGFDEVYLDASNAINCFPKAAIVGDDFTWTSVRDALTALVDNLKVRIGAEGNVWWVSRP